MHVLSAFGSPAEADRYSANSYTRGGLGHRSTVEDARRLLNGDAGYVFDTKLHRTALVQPFGFELEVDEYNDYWQSVVPDSDEAEIFHLLRIVGVGGIQSKWLAGVHPQAEC